MKRKRRTIGFLMQKEEYEKVKDKLHTKVETQYRPKRQDESIEEYMDDFLKWASTREELKEFFSQDCKDKGNTRNKKTN